MPRSNSSIVLVEDSDGEGSFHSGPRGNSRRRFSPDRNRDSSSRSSVARGREKSPLRSRSRGRNGGRDGYDGDRRRYFSNHSQTRNSEGRGQDYMNISPGSSPLRYAEPIYRQSLLPESALLPIPREQTWNDRNMYPAAPELTGLGYMGDQYRYPAGPEVALQDPSVGLQRDVIHFELSTVVPPAVDGHVPKPTRERPQGCRTIFVGGLPDKISEAVLTEVFSRAGPVVQVRICMNPRKNFAHIRFAGSEFVDNALLFSGYRIHIDGRTTPEYTGRMHVDYAAARDDQAEWHEVLRQQEDAATGEEGGVKTFTDAEIQNLSEALKSDFEFDGSANELIKWLERGTLDKKSFNNLYSMLQTTISHMRRLKASKEQAEEEFISAKQLYQFRVQAVSDQMNLVEKVFSAVSRQKIWDKFTKPQRKNIEGWKKQITSAHKVEYAEFQRQYVLTQYQPTKRVESTGAEAYPQYDGLSMVAPSSAACQMPAQGGSSAQQLECSVQPYQMFFPQYHYDARANTGIEGSVDVKSEATEMDLSDSEEKSCPKNKAPRTDSAGSSDSFKEENETLRFQLDAYKNEVNVIKNEMKSEIDNKDRQLQLLQQTLQGLQKQMHEMSRDKFSSQRPAPSTSAGLLPPMLEADPVVDTSGRMSSFSTHTNIPDREARLIGVLTTFLHVHPMGAGIDYIISYVQRVVDRIPHSEVEQVLSRYPSMFRQSVTGVGANMERKWVLTVFDSCQVRV